MDEPVGSGDRHAAGLEVSHSRVLTDCLLSDHLPLATEIRIPDAVRAATLEHRLPLID